MIGILAAGNQKAAIIPHSLCMITVIYDIDCYNAQYKWTPQSAYNVKKAKIPDQF